MAKAKFQFNPKTLSFERIDNTIRHRIKNFMSHLASGLLMGLAFFIIFALFIPSPHEKELRSENAELESRYKLLSSQLNELKEVLTDIEQRDDQLYRVVVQADPVAANLRRLSHSQSKFDDIREKTNSVIAAETVEKLDNIRRQMYIQSVSFDEVINLVRNKEEMLLCIPGIQPVKNKDLKRMASGFGYRIDPIYKTPKFHAGMDFSGNIGSEIYATGKATIIHQGWMQGYGNCIILDHGYGYKTLYGHLDHYVKNLHVGSKVNRGDVIAYMGNTGKSTGPHLHYEVHYRDKVTDPRNFYYIDLSPKEYDEMIQITSNNGNVYD
ncbi:MAG: M23 family metallopeptidase [Paludibacteraceae bacterium]|nr:M23 family metallopeptidase [Paludibacteraceae bacterium]